MERIVDEEFKGIVKALPIQIKLDILKEDILEIYNYEKEIEDEILDLDLAPHDYTAFSLPFGNLSDLRFNLRQMYKHLAVTLNLFELDEDSKLNLYMFCKQKRKDLGLKDNIINMFEPFVNKKYNELNEKINKRNNL